MNASPEFDPLLDEQPARFVVGIDLGTTNSAVAYVDTAESAWQIQGLAIPQLTAAGVVEPLETLPSFHYEAAAGEAAGGAWRLPWQTSDPSWTIGVWAREQGNKTSGRVIASAKSWLCHSGIDRTAAVLPWHAAADVTRLSPVEAAARVLRHIHDAWNGQFGDHPLRQQDVVLTLPASFDEVARELTVQAAAQAGLPRVVLLEEPQAAFYAWVYKHRQDWSTRAQAGQTILVCDIGGGTTDFTLIRVRSSQQAGDARVQFHRVAVGNHLILGGDNLDLALARQLEQRLTDGGRLPPHHWDVLAGNCRRVKEQLLAADAPARLTIHLPGSGSRLLGGSLQLEVGRDEVRGWLLEGFLPATRLEDRPEARPSGFQEFGLPYAADPAITRYLAAFLTAHRAAVGEDSVGEDSAENVGPAAARPDLVLLNGGFFASPVLRDRLLQVLASWFQERDTTWAPVLLENDRLDLAVARGAAYYGMVRRGEGVRIAANLARSYYVQVEADSDISMSVCLVPGAAEPGQRIELSDRAFQLRISEPVSFPLLVSSTRLTDAPGSLVPVDPEQMRALPPIRTVLRTQSKRETGTVAVRLRAQLTEIGTIELWCDQLERDRSWQLQFDVRSATQTDIQAHRSDAEAEGVVDEATWKACHRLLVAVFGAGGTPAPDQLMKALAAAVEAPKHDWPTPLLRRMWETLLQVRSGRRLSPEHEARWLNLVGYALRPGYGLAVDDWRVAETWRHVQGKLVHHTGAVRNEALVLWRRIAGGLSRGQQQALADPLLSSVRGLQRRYSGRKTRTDDVTFRPTDLAEIWRLLGALELLDVPRKIEVGNIVVALLPKRKLEAVRGPMLWALGRMGQRVPVYGPLNTVVPGEVAERWLDALLGYVADTALSPLAVMQLARRTDDRYRDLSEPRRREAAQWLAEQAGGQHLAELVLAGRRLDAEEQRHVFGETLPIGLSLE